ncbi:uncharacterized protein LOC134289692 [Aedes albopictus]|uniref:Reverse transcriptase domain-containing protein n=1 Tax=Aedes albopictus TaxID=7160 RepID=A0ABM1YHX8_AEDAL
MSSRFLTHACTATRRFIKDNPDVVIVESDKGKQTVLLYEKDYDSKMREMLADQHTYEVTAANPTSGYQRMNNNIVSRLRSLSLIVFFVFFKTAYQLKTNAAQCPRIYGLPKVHKQNMPLRPVVSNIGAPTYMLSKYIGKILQASINSSYNIRDSFSFCSFINSVRLPDNYVLVSFDVTSLFTCIPRDLVSRTVIERWQEIRENTDICLDLFLEIVEFCLGCNYFSYKGKYYKQIFGTAMGSPLSPAVADLVMESLLDNVVGKIDCPVPVLKKYVDDLILALPPDKIAEVLNIFNSFDPNIQFTCEMEQDGKIPFLDMTLVRKHDQTIRTEWYCKPMASGRLVDYLSGHPLHLKMNTVTNFIHRVREFTTNAPRETANQIIDETLRINHYPTSLRHRLLSRNTNRTSINTTVNETPTIYKPMLFVNDLTQRLRKSFEAVLPNITLAPRYENTTRRMFNNMKDTVPMEMRNNVIYRIPCHDCDASYVGLTTTLLKQRLSSHRTTMNQLERLRNNGNNDATTEYELERLKEKTALLQHSIEHDHRFDLEKTTILDQHRRQSALPILEVCSIINTPRTVNKRSDIDSLSSMYVGILHTLKNQQSNSRNTTTHQTHE